MHYHYPLTSNFPDQRFLKELLEQEQEKFFDTHNQLEQLLTYSSSAMNWIGDFLFDKNIQWEEKVLAVNDLYLTGTNPEWNKVIMEECDRSPVKLKARFATDPDMTTLFAAAIFNEQPLLIRLDDDKYKVFNGMHRAIAAIRDGKKTVKAFVAISNGKAAPVCEAHIVYDVLRAYIRKINTDREGLITTLRYLRKSYINVDSLLRERFNYSGVPDQDVQALIEEALKDS